MSKESEDIMLRKKQLLVFILSVLSVSFIFFQSTISVTASSDFSFVLLSRYKTEMKIGETFYLVAITSTGKKASFSSSASKIASVNTYGKVIAKKSGIVTITAKIKNAEASCKVTVKPTNITLNRNSASMENGSTLALTASSSTATTLKWKSSKSSIASVSKTGVVTAKKPGECIVTASADGTNTSCTVTVKKPSISLNKSKVTLYRKGTYQLSATISSGLTPKWKSNRKSIATVDNNGKITAIKHGTALITITIDGVSKICEVVVKQPEVTLSQNSLTIKAGKSFTLKANVSSLNSPNWHSSNTNVATVSEKGTITAKKIGKAYIYASEDGVKSRCTVTVTK